MDTFSQDISQCLSQNLNIFSQSFYLNINDTSQDTQMMSQDISQNMSQNISHNISQNMSQSMSQNTSISQSACQSFIPPEQVQVEETLRNPKAPQSGKTSANSTHGGYFDSLSLLLGVAQNLGDTDYAQYSHPETSMISQSTQLSNTNYEPSQRQILGHDERLNTTESLSDTLRNVPFGRQDVSKPGKRKRVNKEKSDHKIEKYLKRAIKEILVKDNDILDSLPDDQLALQVARKLKSKSFSRLLKRVENLLPEFSHKEF